ncbi:hypothetical protein DL96DRAFT_494053 [Flagelloscypha sp. PMI_526]|nr:hypothetical protein DL96DRAFT_494053 [Flagelloscypha sp. PMI_526]
MHAMSSPPRRFSATHVVPSPRPGNPITGQLFDSAIYPPLATPGEATPSPSYSYNQVPQVITPDEYAASGNTLNVDFANFYRPSLSYASSVLHSHANAVATTSYSSSSTNDALRHYTPSSSSAPSQPSPQHVFQLPQVRVDQPALTSTPPSSGPNHLHRLPRLGVPLTDAQRQVVQRAIFAATLQVQSLFAAAVVQEVTSRSWNLPNQTHVGHDTTTPLPLTSFLMYYPGTNILIEVFFGQRQYGCAYLRLGEAGLSLDVLSIPPHPIATASLALTPSVLAPQWPPCPPLAEKRRQGTARRQTTVVPARSAGSKKRGHEDEVGPPTAVKRLRLDE